MNSCSAHKRGSNNVPEFTCVLVLVPKVGGGFVHNQSIEEFTIIISVEGFEKQQATAQLGQMRLCVMSTSSLHTLRRHLLSRSCGVFNLFVCADASHSASGRTPAGGWCRAWPRFLKGLQSSWPRERGCNPRCSFPALCMAL